MVMTGEWFIIVTPTLLVWQKNWRRRTCFDQNGGVQNGFEDVPIHRGNDLQCQGNLPAAGAPAGGMGNRSRTGCHLSRLKYSDLTWWKLLKETAHTHNYSCVYIYIYTVYNIHKCNIQYRIAPVSDWYRCAQIGGALHSRDCHRCKTQWAEESKVNRGIDFAGLPTGSFPNYGVRKCI